MNFPHKTKVPILLICALLFWASTALSYYITGLIDDKSFISSNILFINIILLIFILSIGIITFRTHMIFSSIFISAIIGIMMSLNAAIILENQKANITDFSNKDCTIEAVEDQKNGNSSNSCLFEINHSTKIKVQLDDNTEEIHKGDLFDAKLNIYEASDSQKENYWQNGISANAKLIKLQKIERSDPIGVIYKFRNNLIDTIRSYDNNNNSQAEQLLNAIVCGQKIDLNQGKLYESFKTCGLAHMVAVSGAHLSLVTAILIMLLRLFKLKKRWIVFTQSIFIFSYLICAGVPISALRAAFMAYIAIFSFFGKRRPAPLSAIGICIFILIAINPQTSLSVSFALSVGSTIGIILFSSLFEYLIKTIFDKCPKFICSILALTLSASICSQPISISVFNQFSIISPVANIICTPLFSVVCGGGLLLSITSLIISHIFAPLSDILMSINYFLSDVMASIVNLIAKIPYAAIPANINIFIGIGITLTLCYILYHYWDKFENLKKGAIKISSVFVYSSVCAALIILIIIIIPKASQTELVMFDIGQGDSIYLSSGGKNFLIDTGNQDSKLKNCLANKGITHLDGILITHPDDDHCGSLDVIEQVIDVTKIYVAKDLKKCDDKNCQKLMSQLKNIVDDKSIIGMSVDDKINFGEVELDVIWPDRYKDNGGNSDSLCVIANIDVENDGLIDSRALLVGDAEKDEIKELFAKNRLPKIDIYKCGHHGSKNAIDDSLAKKLSPAITLVSVGAKNRYGHPSQKTLTSLEQTSSQIYRTDKQGTITCKFNVSFIDISTEK